MLELQSLKNLPKKLLIFIAKISGIFKKLMNEFWKIKYLFNKCSIAKPKKLL
jgi:hypothetical protein